MAKQSKPTVGDPFILEGRKYRIASIAGQRVTAELPKDAGHVTLALADLEWHEAGKAWTLPGRFDVPPVGPAKLVAGPPPKQEG